MTLATAAAAAVAHWSMDESAGSTRVDSINTYNLTDHATVGSAAGKFNNAAVFVSASSQFLSRANGTEIATADEDVSWSLWWKSPSSLASVNQIIFARRAGNGVINYSLFYSQVHNSLIWTYGTISVVSSVSISTSTWYYVSCNHDSVNNTINIRVNGNTTDSGADTGFDPGFPISADLDVGADVFGQYLDGTVDDMVFMRSYVFTDADHDLAYASGTGVAFTSWSGGGGIIAQPYYPLLLGGLGGNL